MKTPEPLAITVHEDAAFFREALRFTAAHSGFTGRLIEKTISARSYWRT
jgi:hypothetical protein